MGYVRRLRVCWRLFRLWNHAPYQRMGQLLVNSTLSSRSETETLVRLFYSKDDEVLGDVETFLEETGRKTRWVA